MDSGGGFGAGLDGDRRWGSHVHGSVWPSVVAVCGGWMVGRLQMGMSITVWMGRVEWMPPWCRFLSAAGGLGMWWPLGPGGRGVSLAPAAAPFVIAGAACGGVGGAFGPGSVVGGVLLFALGFQLWSGIRRGLRDRFEAEEDFVPEMSGERCRAGGLPGMLPGRWSRPCSRRGAVCQEALRLRLWLWPLPCG